MKLSMYILRRWFHSHGYKTHAVITDGSAKLVGARISDDINQQAIACILTKDSDCGLVSIVNGSDILFITNVSDETVLNAANEAFEYYNAWEVQLLRSAFQQASLQDLLDIANLAIMRPMLIKNCRQELCAITESYGPQVHPMWSEYLKHADHLPARFYDPNHSYNELTEVSIQRQPKIDFSPLYGGSFLYANLWTNDRRVGHICAYEHNQVFDDGDVQIMSVFQSIVNFYVSANPVLLFALSAMEEYMASVLSSGPPPKALPEEIMASCGWSAQDTLTMLVLRPEDTSVPVRMLMDIQSDLDQKIHPMYEIQLESDNVYLINMSQFRTDRPLRDILEEVPDISHMRWGISNPFQGISNLSNHYSAALKAIQWARDRNLQGAYIQEAVPSLFIGVLGKIPNLDVYLCPAVRILKRYDEQNGTHFGEALFWYLFYNRNLQMAAVRMDAHRNTINKWILKIFEMIGQDDFDSFSSRMSYLLSFLLENPKLF